MIVHGYTATGAVDATIDGLRMAIPDDPSNRHRRMIASWEADGNIIPPYVLPAAVSTDVNAERDRRIQAGTTITVTGYGPIPLTGRERDQINLITLASRAQAMKAAGLTAAGIVIRDRDNINHTLTPDQMIELVSAGTGWIEATMKVSWDMKDSAGAFPDGIPPNYTDDLYWP
ncbi:DUF4376 domain-containing protein [Rhizobium sp. CAU 1783]